MYSSAADYEYRLEREKKLKQQQAEEEMIRAALESLPPLHKAARSLAAPAEIKELFRNGEDPNFLDFFGRGPLHYAVESDQALVAAALLKGGALVDLKDGGGRTPLLCALESENKTNKIKVVSMLITWGADINVKDTRGITALSWIHKRRNRLKSDDADGYVIQGLWDIIFHARR